MMRLIVPTIVLLLFTTACAPAVSRSSLELVDPLITFEEVLQAPDRHVGRYLLLGGVIAAAQTHGIEGSELEVVQLPTTSRGRITSIDQTAGRFIAWDPALRDPAIYRPGRLITLVGEVTGSRSGRIGEKDYLFPVLRVHELRLWAPGEHPDVPRTRFGIGIGIGIGL